MALPESLQRDAVLAYPELKDLSPQVVNILLGYAYKRGYNDALKEGLSENPTLKEAILTYDRQHLIRINHDTERGLMSLKYNLYADSFTSYNRSPEGLSWTLPYMLDFRGLVVDTDTYRVVARPYPKFFNLNENALSKWPDEYVSLDVSDKLDGSLVIYVNDDYHGEVFASSGSTCSTHARDFKRWFDKNQPLAKRLKMQELGKTWTLNLEYTAPDNQIVVKYDDERMTLHGAINTETGEVATYEELIEFANEIGVDIVKRHSLQTLSEIQTWLSSHNQEDIEGLVLTFTHEDGSVTRLKLKTEQYIDLHYQLARAQGLFVDLSHTILTNRAKQMLINAYSDESLDDIIATVTDGRDAIYTFIDDIKKALVQYHKFSEMYGTPTPLKRRLVVGEYNAPEEESLLRTAWANQYSDLEYLLSWNEYN